MVRGWQIAQWVCERTHSRCMHPAKRRLRQHRVRGQGQELDELIAARDGVEQLARLLVAGAELGDLLVGHRADVLAREAALVDPLPDLCARDLRRRGVLHQVEDRDGAGAAQPGLDVLDRDGDVVAQALLGDLARGRGDVEQRGGVGDDVLAQNPELVGASGEHAVEDLHRDRHEVGVRDPGSVIALGGLALLVLAHLRQRHLVDLGVAPRRDERRHPADRVGTAAVAGRHQQLGVGAHERHPHADRNAVGMGVPFMRAYAELLVATCHRRGAHAIGGMAAFIPSRRNPEVNAVALAKVREDKEREASQGYDGTWVAHRDLVPIALEVFDRVLGQRPNQLEVLREDITPDGGALLDIAATPGEITEAGLRNNISVGIQYIQAWLGGSGAVAIFNLMEDAATSEISRAQVWQWIDQGRFTREHVRTVTDEEVAKLGPGYEQARELFDRLATGDEFVEFLTLPAYSMLA